MPAVRSSPRFPPPRHDHRRCAAAALARAERLCRARGRRLTSARRRVLEMIWARHKPVTAYALLAQLRRGSPRAAPIMVYRALAFLEEQGLIHRIASRQAYIGCRAPGARCHGQLMLCERCGDAVELDDPDITAMLRRRARRSGFRVAAPIVELPGLCPACRAD